jgi:hypothetical protein
MTEVLLEEVGPNGNVQAIVECDDRVCFLYLFGAENTQIGTKAVWVRNLMPAPDQLDVAGMKAGQTPMNPVRHCRSREGLPRLKPENFRVIWLPEGNGVALYEGDEPLAIIPPWSGIAGFDGYASDAIGEGPLAWELASDNVLRTRFAQAEEYWKSWDDPDLWPNVQASFVSAIETAIGPHSDYYAIDGGHWPPKALLRVPYQDAVVLITVGVSLRPQPNVEMSTDEPESLRRIELATVLPIDLGEQQIQQIAAYLSGQSQYPWEHYTWLGHGHTLPCDSWGQATYPFAWLVDQHPRLPKLNLPQQCGDPVSILWFIPITAEERAAAETGESLVDMVPADRWRTAFSS